MSLGGKRNSLSRSATVLWPNSAASCCWRPRSHVIKVRRPYSGPPIV